MELGTIWYVESRENASCTDWRQASYPCKSYDDAAVHFWTSLDAGVEAVNLRIIEHRAIRPAAATFEASAL